MLRNKLNYFLIILLLLNGFLYSQTKDYRQLYHDLTKGLTSEKSFYEKTSEFFNSFDNTELPVALASISKGENANFVAYNLIDPNKRRLEEKIFRDNLLTQFSIKPNPSSFKMVVIDFFSEYLEAEQDSEEKEYFNKILFALSKDKSYPNILRSYAASHGSFNKEQLSELLSSGDYSAINGASRSLKRVLHSDDVSKTDKNYLVSQLIAVINQNTNNLDSIKNVIYTLGYTRTDEAKNVLLNLFTSNASSNPAITETLIYSMSSVADTKILNTIFTEYSNNEQYNNYGSELTLKEFVSNNNDVIEKLYYEKNEESNLNFLRAVRLMKDENRIKYLEKVKNSLSSSIEAERLESIRTLHFLLPYEEEVIIFKNHVANENSEIVKNQIYFYVGE